MGPRAPRIIVPNEWGEGGEVEIPDPNAVFPPRPPFQVELPPRSYYPASFEPGMVPEMPPAGWGLAGTRPWLKPGSLPIYFGYPFTWDYSGLWIFYGGLYSMQDLRDIIGA